MGRVWSRRSPLPQAGKTRDDWVAASFCDFGVPGRRDIIARHFALDSAHRQFRRHAKVYGTRPGERFWLETRDGTVMREVRG